MAEHLNNNVKHLRSVKGISQQTLADKVGVDRSTISRIENGEIETTIDNAMKIANVLKVNIEDLITKDLTFDNGTLVDVDCETIQIPVLGTIKAGIAIEAQEDILEYVDIPKDWVKGGKTFYGLKISGDSMFPKYNESDIVIFEHTEDYVLAQNKDCAVMVNGFDATFKNVTITEMGITLVPLNLNNSDNYQPTFYSKEQIATLPVKIVGIAREKRTRL
nr:MAG TPA: Repressor protein CI [Caudoviricetes sp.]